MLVHRFMAAGRATGAYWAMPTQATANAMYARQAEIIERYYDMAETRPSLILSHSQQQIHRAFRATVLDGSTDAGTVTRSSSHDDIDDLPGTAICTAWLADNRRAAMLADMGAGTIDQALLGILPSRFNTLRLFGLADKVLVVDEAHAYDADMGVELAELLRFHAALGGNAIVLSATLPRGRRAEIATAWRDGVAGGQRLPNGGVVVQSDAYPLGTVVAKAGVLEHRLQAAEMSHRSVNVRLIHEIDAAAEWVAAAAAKGAAVAWIRNTVDDCLSAARVLRERHGLEAMVFHARFAQCDRQRRELEVLTTFGKDSSAGSRHAKVLVATQVIEQSLDLDFDAMITDVAPIDLLIQRAGRLWRHKRSRPNAYSPCELIVVSPASTETPSSNWLDALLPGTAKVYKNVGVLWRTVRVLDRVGAITTPAGLRELIESVYGDSYVPEALLHKAHHAEGQESGNAAVATFATLKVKDGYDASALAWVSELRARTRLSDDQTVVRLARICDDGELAPWDESAASSWPAWALSEVKLSSWRVPRGTVAEVPFAEAIARARAKWGPFEQEIPVLPLTPSGNDWLGRLVKPDGRSVDLIYNPLDGLAYVPRSAGVTQKT
jgi:CRISPR-associated endonuclease/helicase Cas3